MAELCRGNHLPEVEVSSAATTREEIGNDIYPPMKKALRESGYRCPPHAARQTVPGDYDRYDYLIGMDHENLSDMKGIYGGDPLKKISLLRAGPVRRGSQHGKTEGTGRKDHKDTENMLFESAGIGYDLLRRSETEWTF